MPRLADTDAEALEVMTALYRRMSPLEKLERVRQLTLASSWLFSSGLASRHPSDSDVQPSSVARLRLGETMVRRVYAGRET